MAILNLTQHLSTPEQGAIEPKNKGLVQKLLTFDQIPCKKEVERRASELAHLAADELGNEQEKFAMIGGAPFLMSALERALWRRGIRPVYAFSRREVEETVDASGAVRKVAVFRHIGYVEP